MGSPSLKLVMWEIIGLVISWTGVAVWGGTCAYLIIAGMVKSMAILILMVAASVCFLCGRAILIKTSDKEFDSEGEARRI